MTHDTWQDPVVTEVRKNRETIYEEYGGDMRKYEEHLQELESDLKAKGWKVDAIENLEARKALHRQQQDLEYRKIAAL